jgi:hypothetical protein
MRYMLLMCDDGTENLSPEGISGTAKFAAWQRDVDARGVHHRGVRLRPPVEAVTVRVRGGELQLTDGPFAETKEQISGYELIECADLDQAIEVAAGHPTAAGFAVEIRPFWEG